MNAGSNIALHSGTAAWIGDGVDGVGFVSTESGALQGHRYAIDGRFNNAAGTNPEELIAAAHAGSFTLFLSLLLAEAGFTVERIDTTALLTLEKDLSISRIHLVLTASIPFADASTFQSLATKAMENCIVSRLLSTEITLSAKLSEQNAVAGQGDWLDQPIN